jgi:catechol 2,3-dioxygenase-like lactoylglutathione lyase family enzyme
MLRNLSCSPFRLAAFTAAVFFGGFAVRANFFPDESNFSSTTIDFGTVVSDIDKSVAWYKDVIGFGELDGFDVPGEFAADIGLSNKLPFHVHVLTLGEGESATKLKLMQFKNNPGARVNNEFIHSSYGFRYLTIFVKDLNKALDQAAAKGAKPISKGAHPLPPGFPEGLGIAVLRDPDGNAVELVGPWKK